MLDNDHIKACAKKAARVAYAVLGLDCHYSIVFIHEPTIQEDARLDTTKNEIQINLALLKPFSTEAMPCSDNLKEEEKQIDENYRHIMKIFYLVYHEMRHIYQKRAVEAYLINQRLGGRVLPPLESDKKCALWLNEMQTSGPDLDIEKDADDFAYYLTNRYPVQLPMLRTSRRLAAMKRKYDKMEIEE